MEVELKLIGVYFTIMSKINSNLAAEQAFKLFQKPRKIPFKKREQKFFDTANRFTVDSGMGEIMCYDIGKPDGEIVFLVHGWDSNAGSMSGIGTALAGQGYYVVSFDLPAHGMSKEKYANLLTSKIAMKAVVNRVKTDKPISVVSHSFGSFVTAIALSEMNVVVKNLIYLTTPDKAPTIFEYYRDLIKLGDKPYQLMVKKAEELLNAPLESMNVLEKTSLITFEKLTLIHDKHDKILPYENSLNLNLKISNSELISFEKVGHYRMLWNEQVIEKISKLMQRPKVFSSAPTEEKALVVQKEP
ncbi:MAG: alpha/beta hydrolase [Flavobacteriales bacterium]|nr:alpha/beta hydrolase [Flavobacteriales bacterium]